MALDAPSGLEALTEGIRLGVDVAGDELVQRFHEKAFVMALVRLGDREAARDVAQETMLAVLHAVREGRVREPERLAGYVCGTARNLVNEHLRARRPSSAPGPPDPAPTPNAEQELEQTEQRFLVHRVLESLGASDRRVLLLSLVDGLTPAQIGERMGMRPDAVRQRKSRALQRARAMLERLSHPPSGHHFLARETRCAAPSRGLSR